MAAFSGITFKAPALPLPPANYNKVAAEEYNRVLRLYFNRIDAALRQISHADVDNTQVIASGSIEAHGTRQLVDTEAAAAADDLDTISINSTPTVIYLFGVDAARVVTVKHLAGTGNISTTTAADVVLDSLDKGVMLVRADTKWLGVPLF